jgi:hypothetical protein
MPDDLSKLILADPKSCRDFARLHVCASLILDDMAKALENHDMAAWGRCVADLQDLAEKQDDGQGLQIEATA